jgi:hypothetical protein
MCKYFGFVMLILSHSFEPPQKLIAVTVTLQLDGRGAIKPASHTEQWP